MPEHIAERLLELGEEIAFFLEDVQEGEDREVFMVVEGDFEGDEMTHKLRVVVTLDPKQDIPDVDYEEGSIH